MNLNPIFVTDMYKTGHVHQYPAGTTKVYSNWTARYARTERERKGTIHFGLQYFIKKYLLHDFQKYFFERPWAQIESEYREFITATLGVEHPKVDHIKRLHNKGYLPLKIYSLPEGSFVPVGVPSVVIVNTHDDEFWLPNYIETMFSNSIWKASTSATTATIYRQIFEKWAKKYGHTDMSFVDWQGHDFSYRGMSGLEDAALSGMGHLLSFKGTDTIPAIFYAKEYYGADFGVAGSVPATEHSVMCAGSKDGEFDTFKRLLTETYPTGIISVVSDTWDLWKVLTDYIPRLKGVILNRKGKVVIRPDSGDPVKILCGDPNTAGPAFHGAIRLLAEALGTTNGLINNAALIYGDSITPERAESICQKTVESIGLSPYNVVFGIGSFTYEYTTRDAYGHAMKATAVEQNGKLVPIFKNPVTDDGGKKSLRGIPAVYRGRVGQGDVAGRFYVEDGKTPADLDQCDFDKVYEDGVLLHVDTFKEIRERVQRGY